jgi:hypothetical protein
MQTSALIGFVTAERLGTHGFVIGHSMQRTGAQKGILVSITGRNRAAKHYVNEVATVPKQ